MRTTTQFHQPNPDDQIESDGPYPVTGSASNGRKNANGPTALSRPASPNATALNDRRGVALGVLPER